MFEEIIGGIKELIPEAISGYLDVLKEQEMAKAKAAAVEAQAALERAKAEAAKAEAERIAAERAIAAAEAPEWTKYIPWILLAVVAFFALKK